MTAAAAPHPSATWPWTIAFAAITLPFAPFWPDFEQGRRGLALVVIAALVAVGAWRQRASGMRSAPLAAWFGLVALHLLSTLWATNAGEAWARAGWLLGLGAVAWTAAGVAEPRTVLRAILPTGILVAAYGLAQGAGLEWPSGYGDPADAVSTLGNRNAASEVMALAVVAAALGWIRADRAPLAGVTLLLGAAYLWVNQSRSGLVAVALTVLPLALAPWRHHPGRRRMALLALLALGAFGGEVVRRAGRPGGAPPPSTAAVPDAIARPAQATLDVRLEIWTAALPMWREAPLLGHGSGQFKVDYPRFRREREIELSSIGRQQAAAPRSAHNDPIEIALETGALGLALFVAFWLAVAGPHRHGGGVGLLPLVAFVLLGLVRAPLANAPAAVFAFAWAGALARTRPAPDHPLRRRAGALGLAGLLIWAGLPLLLAQSWAAEHVDEQRRLPEQRQTLVQMHALDRAVAWLPWDSQIRALRTRLRFALARGRSDPGAEARALMAPGGDVETLLALAPHSTANLLTAAEVASAAGEPARAEAWLRRILALDPPHPEARLFLATLETAQGDARGAVDILYADGHPHPRLLEGLATHLRDLAARADAAGRDLLAGEAEFIAAFLALRADPDAATTVRALGDLARGQADRGQRDQRPAILIAARLLALGQRDAVEAVAAQVRRLPPLRAAERALLEEFLAPLRAFPAWAAVLDARP